MTAGALRQRMLIERAAGGADGGGGAITVWTPLHPIWAAIEPVSRAEADLSGRLDGMATHRIRVRRGSGLRGGDRLRAGERILRVLVVEAAEAGALYQVCLAEEEGR